MSRLVLLVCGTPDLGDVVQNRLENDLNLAGTHIEVLRSSNETDAMGLLRDRRCELLVTEDVIPADSLTPPNPTERRGVALVKSVQLIRMPAVVLTSSVGGDLLFETQKLSRCYVVPHGEPSWVEHLLGYCREILQPTRPTTSPPAEAHGGKVEIVVDLSNESFRYKLEGVGIPYTKYGNLQIDPKVMQKLRNRSDNVGQIDKWEPELHDIGEELMQEFFKNNLGFFGELAGLAALVGGSQKMTIEFFVERTVHNVALEALCDWSDPQKFLMLSTPIYRKLNAGGETYPLFQSEGGAGAPLNCLIIEADVNGVVDGFANDRGQPLRLEPLTNVQEEGEWLFDYLDAARSKLNLMRLEKVSQASSGHSFWQTVQCAVQNEHWDIVHYTGHSSFVERRGAFLFLPGHPIEPISAEAFSRALKRPRFVYISSCRSSHASFVFELAQQNVASILGFRWDIDDRLAAEHARRFYEALFESHSLQHAFLTTRQKMHEKAPDDRIWAAPILMM